MRSEGFPFIVGVWGWTCVRFVLLPRRRPRNRRFSSWKCEIWRRSRTKCSFWRFKLSRWEVIFAFCVAGARLWKLLLSKVAEVSHETLVLEASALKSCGSLARNAPFGSLLLEKLRKPRTKRSFWKQVVVKSWGSLARNARFGSLFLEKLRKPRTKWSFWKQVMVKSWGSLARNARFGSFCITL